jgi:hypothetical protein
MNDHDLIIKLGAQMDYLIKEVQNLRDGTKKDILDLQVKVDLLEKADIKLHNKIDSIGREGIERAAAISLRLTAVETSNTLGVQKTESNRAYIWRKALDWIMPFVFIIGGLVLSKLGILNLQ